MNNISNNTAELSTEEKRALLAQLLREKAKNKSVPKSQCVHEWFEVQVEQTPDAIAVVFQDRKLTYRELNQRANQLAHYLRSLGAVTGGCIGICLEPSLDLVVGLLGILKAGGAYVPLAPNYPKDWLKFVLANSQVSAILTKESLKEFLTGYKGEIICIDADRQAISQHNNTNLVSHAKPESIAYVIYSSKRGIPIQHRGVNHRLDWLQKQFSLSASDAVLNKASLAEDTAVWEILLPLVTGGKLVIADRKDPIGLKHAIATQEINLICFSPSELATFLESLDTAATLLRSLRVVFGSGEPLVPTLVETFYRHFDCELHYLYTLPEAGGEVTAYTCKKGENKEFLPIGRPTNKSVYVLDNSLQLVPLGVTGEIYVGGTELTPGYLHNAEATAQCFVKNPFAQTPDARLFKTGELGRLLNDGTIELVGSLHRQAWIEGFRVNLLEVEAALLSAPMVEDCRVQVRSTHNGISEMVAYVVLSGPFQPAQLQSHLRSQLPPYMVPRTFAPLTSLPLTSSAQVDEQALMRLAVLDADLVQRWETSLQSLPEIEQVAAVVQAQTESLPPLHLSDLLPDWKRFVSGNDAQVATPNRSYEIESDFSSNKLAIVHGEPLPKDRKITNTLSKSLQKASQQTPTKGLVYVQSDGSEIEQSYRDLLEDAERILAGLRRLGLKPQDQVIFQLDLTQDFIPAFWGCVLGGFVPVPVSVAPTYDQINSGVTKLQNVWQMLDKPLILTGKRLAAGVSSLPKLLGLEQFKVAVIDDLRICEPENNWHISQPEDLALLMLTSGSTGIPKGVTLRHCNLLSMAAATAAFNKFNCQDVTLNWMPMDHVGALVFLSIMAVDLGCQQIHVPTEFILQNPLHWLDLIDRHKATISWAPNFAFTLICDRAEEINRRKWNLSSMRFLVNAGEAVVAKTARNFLKLLGKHGLPSTALRPAFGMCETCSGISWSQNFSLETTSDDDAFVDVGLPIAGASFRIVDENGRIVEEGKIGRLQLKGKSLTSGYYQNPEANRQAFNEEGWFTTGDLGFIRNGCLTITGREKDIIIINGFNYYSHEIESAVEEIEGIEVSYTAACAVREGGNTDKLAIFFNSTLTDETRLLSQFKEIRAKVIEKVGINPDYLIPIEKENVPKTAIGKIQRSQLSKRFEAGEFNDILKRFDLLTVNANTLPNWFYRKVWRQKETTKLVPTAKGKTLIFLDGLKLGDFLFSQLEQSCDCVKVEVGKEFAQVTANHYRIAPGHPEDYQLLLESLAVKDEPITQILHLWTYDKYAEISSLESLAETQKLGGYSLLFLVQALAKIQGSAHPVQLQVISNYAQVISGDNAIAYAKSPILGLIKTIPLEMPWLSCRHVDLPIDKVERNAAHILQELSVLSKDKEVAYRNGKRLISRLELVELSQSKKQPLPFKQGGFYLISGGLGDLGVEVSKYLLQHYQARLLLVGRTPLSERIQTYETLQQLGGEVIYQTVNVCDLAELQETVKQTEMKWGCQLDGIIHLAGVYQEHLLLDETPDSFADTLQPKVLGTWTLHQLLKDKPESIFISFSSIANFFGGAMIGAYAAANNFLESFCQFQRSHSVQSYCFAWSTWDGLGVSKRSQMQSLAQAKGYYAMNSKQGLHSLLAGLHHNQTQLLVGLDGSNANIRRYLLGMGEENPTEQRLTAYFTTTTKDLPIAKMQSLVVCDRFQTPSTCEFVQLEKMPLTDTGAIDLEQLKNLNNGRRVSSEKVAPRNEIDRQIAQIWQEVLGISQIGIYDNFFELGGNSLLAVQLISRVSETFKVELSLTALLQAQTIAGLTDLLQGSSKPESPLVAIQPKGTKPPFFCIHPVGGNVICYGDLARYLGTEQPFYGLQSLGLNGNSQPLTSVKEMASCYIEAIRNVQPQGPYYLGGWSLGGIIAYEMAQQLQASGEEVALLAMIDSYAAATVNVPEAVDRAMVLAGVVRDMGGISGKEISISVEELQQLSTDEQLQYVQQKAQQANLLSAEFKLEQMQQLFSVFSSNHYAWFDYIPQPYSGKIALFYASEQVPQAIQYPPKFWTNLAKGGIETHKISGDHYAIVREPQVQILGKQLKAYLS